ERCVAGDVVPGRALGQAAPEDHVLDVGGVDARALDRVPQHVGGHGDAMGQVERAAASPGDGGAAVTHNGNWFHWTSWIGRAANRRRTCVTTASPRPRPSAFTERKAYGRVVVSIRE